MFKDRPNEWHTLPTTKKGLMMIPLAKEACDRHEMNEPPPPPIPNPDEITKGKEPRKKKAGHLSRAEGCDVQGLRQGCVKGTRIVVPPRPGEKNPLAAWKCTDASCTVDHSSK